MAMEQFWKDVFKPWVEEVMETKFSGDDAVGGVSERFDEKPNLSILHQRDREKLVGECLVKTVGTISNGTWDVMVFSGGRAIGTMTVSVVIDRVKVALIPFNITITQCV